MPEGDPKVSRYVSPGTGDESGLQSHAYRETDRTDPTTGAPVLAPEVQVLELAALPGFVDGLEGLLGDLKGYTDGVEGLLEEIRDGVGGSTPASIDTTNSTETPLAAGATFTGTAVDVLAYNQINVQIFGRPGVVAGDGTSAKASFFFEFSKNGTDWDTSVPSLVRDPSLVIPVPIINVHRFFRVRYLNDGGVAAIAALGLSDTAGTPTIQTAFRLTTYLLPQATKELTRTLDQGISRSDPVTLTRAAVMGEQPDGHIANSPLVGVRAMNPATSLLGNGGVYTGEWIDTELYPTVKLLVATDQISANNGIQFQWSDTPTGVTVRTTSTKTFRPGHITDGRFIQVPTRARYLRVRYVNGITTQTRFFMGLLLDPVPLMDIVDIRAFAQFQTGGVILSTAAAQVAATPLPGRRTIRIKNSAASTRVVYYGNSATVSSSDGDELTEGESIEFDADETVAVWVIKASGGAATVKYGEFA